MQAISFFLLAILICAAVVWALWNYLRRDWTKLPRLSFGKALAGVLLWGLLVFIVLTMISGARELMTPGAWRKQGWTYQLEKSAAIAATTPAADRETRRGGLEQLRTALWQYAATHAGDAVEHFGLGPTQLAEKALAYLPPATTKEEAVTAALNVAQLLKK